MQRALTLARRGQGRVHPNPMVGCVVVKNGTIIGEGYHPYYGGPHAEIIALRKAGQAARGATLYLTLEPCIHWGKTPPCLPVVAKSGVKKVYIATKDANPLVSGKGIQGLKAAKIDVHVGLMATAARKLNKFVSKKRPHVLLKLALSLDGKTATWTGDSKWISSPASRKQVHQLRAKMDAVLVGVGTVLKDNPSLTTHGWGRNPIRVVLDPHLRTPRTAKICRDGEARTVLVVSTQVPEKRSLPYQKQGVQILRNVLKNGSFELKNVLKQLSQLNINQVLLEGGLKTAESFIHQNMIDETLFFIAPKLIGDNTKVSQAITLPGPDLVVRKRVK